MSNELKALAKEFLEDISADFPNEKFESEEDCCNFWNIAETTEEAAQHRFQVCRHLADILRRWCFLVAIGHLGTKITCHLPHLLR